MTTSSTKLKSDLKLASERRNMCRTSELPGTPPVGHNLCPTFWFFAPPYQHLGLGNKGGGQEGQSFCHPTKNKTKQNKKQKNKKTKNIHPYKFRLKRAWNYAY